MIAVLVMTDGRRDCVYRSIPEFFRMVRGERLVSDYVIHDDSADPDYRAWLKETYPGWTLIGGQERLGFGGAIQNAWAWLLEHTAAAHVFHLEDDFLITRTVDLSLMVDTLAAHPHLQQLALLRGPVNPEERAAGGIIEQHPLDYVGVTWPHAGRPLGWREHRRFFTTNPSLYRRELMQRGWPTGPESEGHFGLQLFAEDPAARCAFWGAAGEWCEHIGHERVGAGY